ncbi:MAG: adenylate cyclase [Solirubrobacteraceae bacterium]|jgi:adenylate cyclase|nr:adenylate cyclase [Solirubrobacteraceae bacterium]
MAGVHEFEAAGLLDGLEGESRAARLDLLDQLHDAGFSVDQMRAAAAEDRLALLPVEGVLARDEIYSAREVADQAGIPLKFLERIQQAFGLPIVDPDAKSFSEEGLEAARRAARFREFGLPEEGMIEVTRVIGQSMARLSEAIRGLVNVAVIPRHGDSAASERDLGLGYAAVARELLPQLEPLLHDALTAQLRDQIRGDVVARAELAAGQALPGAREVAVGFADLVGFTRLGEARPVDELGAVADRLAELAQAAARAPVRLIKTIGDAAMFVSPEPEALLETMVTLVAAAEEEGEEFPQLKAGLSYGPALNRGGDWYGHTVNVASRVTGIARAGSVLCTEEVRDAADGGWRWSYAGERKLKNVREPVKLFRVRPEPPADDEGEAGA